MASELISLMWHGPFSFFGDQEKNIFTCTVGKKKGVYLFTIPFESSYLVYYVGETGKDFATRLLQHIQSYLNGFYRVFDPDEFVKGNKVLIWGGMWKVDRREQKNICDFLERQSELNPKIIRFIEQFKVFLAPIECDKRTRERIESKIALTLKEQEGIISSFQDQDIRYRPSRKDESPFRVSMSFFELILGLSKELDV